MHFASEYHLDEWGPGKLRSRWDYQTKDHSMADILASGDSYFSRCFKSFRVGDLVHIMSGDLKRATVIIDDIDEVTHKVAYSLEIVHTDQPVMAVGQTIAYRYRGPRGGGHSLVDRAGKLVKSGFASKEEALRYLANLDEAA